MARSAAIQPAFWNLDAYTMEKVVVNFAGEVELLPDNELRDSVELGSFIEFTVKAQVTARKFSLKGTGQVILTVLAIETNGSELLTRKGTAAAQAAIDVTPEGEAPKKRGRPRKADPAFDTCGIVHRGMNSPCMNSRDDCEIEASLQAADERAARVLSEAEDVAAHANEA